MKLIFLHGWPGVGKLTVARELAKLTEFRIFHNHLAVDLVEAVFEFGSQPFVELREKIWLAMFSQAVAAKLSGLIFTFAFDRTVGNTFIQNLRGIVEADGGEVLFVELICSQDELERRLTDPSRRQFGKLNSLELFRELSRAGAFVDPGIPTERLRLDTTDLSASAAAKWIAGSLGLLPEGASERRSLPNESASIQDAYSDWSSTYDQDLNLTRDLDEIVTRKILGNSSCKSIIEVGCGTGKNTPLLAQVGEQVLALDFSEAMINKAKEKLRLENMSFCVADISKPWPCADRSADLVVCNLVLEHIADLEFIFAETTRCLVEDGRFFVCELHPFRQYRGTRAKFQRDQGTTEIEAFVHNVSDFMLVAKKHGLAMESFEEWWHDEDQSKLPRLVSFMFKKGAGS
ncbi:MAG: methyltransferase domain-containing protein [Pyrinomonadaceae bacterium]